MNAGVRTVAAAMLMTVSGLAAAADDPEKPTAAATASANSTSSSHACQTLFKAMAGEWEGTIQTRNAEGMSSSSVVSATLRLEDSGKSLAMYYEGFAFGKPAEGAMLLSAQGLSPRAALVRQGATLGGSGRQDGARLAFRFDAPAGSGKIDGYEQVISLNEPDRLVAELNAVSSSGTKTLVLKLDFSRLEGEQKSAAAESLSNGKSLLSSARTAIDKIRPGDAAQAGVPTE